MRPASLKTGQAITCRVGNLFCPPLVGLMVGKKLLILLILFRFKLVAKFTIKWAIICGSVHSVVKHQKRT